MAESQSLRSSFRRFFEGYLSSLGGRSAFGRLIQQAVDDDNVRRNLIDSPMETLAAAGVVLHEGVVVEVLENTDRVIHIVLPPLVTAESPRSFPS